MRKGLARPHPFFYNGLIQYRAEWLRACAVRESAARCPGQKGGEITMERIVKGYRDDPAR